VAPGLAGPSYLCTARRRPYFDSHAGAFAALLKSTLMSDFFHAARDGTRSAVYALFLSLTLFLVLTQDLPQ